MALRNWIPFPPAPRDAVRILKLHAPMLAAGLMEPSRRSGRVQLAKRSIYDDQMYSFVMRRDVRDGYVVQHEWVLMHIGESITKLDVSYNPAGDYIGSAEDAKYLVEERGIAPELADPDHNVCSIGFCETEQKWYGWSHRAIYGFEIGYVVEAGDLTACSGWVDDYLVDHPEADKSLPVGFEAKTLDDCRRCAVAFADAVG